MECVVGQLNVWSVCIYEYVYIHTQVDMVFWKIRGDKAHNEKKSTCAVGQLRWMLWVMNIKKSAKQFLKIGQSFCAPI